MADRAALEFPRTERLKRRDAFQALFRRGRRVERPSLVVLWRPSSGPRQVGFAVSRQLRGAVRRNRARRRLREAYRACRPALPAGIQLLCLAREPAFHAGFEVLHRDMREALGIIASQQRAAARA